MGAPSANALSARLLRTSAACALAWLVAAGLGLFADRVEALIALAPAVVVPLGYLHTAEPAGPVSAPWRWGAWALTLGAPLGVGALAAGRSEAGLGLSLAWLAATGCVALAGAHRLARRGVRPVEELAIDVGALLLPVGAVWLVASRAGVALLGFREPIVTFTAAHFHFAGFGAATLAGLAGRALPLRRAPGEAGPLGPRWARRAACVSLPVVLAGIPLVAVGITVSRALEGPAAVALGLGMLLLALVLGHLGVRRLSSSGLARRVSGALLLVGAVSLVGSMSLAIAFAVTSSAGRGAATPWLAYRTMADLHGVANAVGFAVCVSLAFAMEAPARAHLRLEGTWPPVLARGRVGPELFDRLGAIDATAEAASAAGEALGQLDDLASFAHEGFSPERVAPSVRHFFEHTSAWELHVVPQWPWWLRGPARLFSWGARRWLGQLELPVAPMAERVVTRFARLRPEAEGRTGARAYVRTYASDPRRAVFVASYGTHASAARRCLVPTFPLPWCTLVGVLRFDDGPTVGGLVVTSYPRADEGPGDEGMFLVTPWGPLRLPLDETIRVEPIDGSMTTARAEHEARALGVRLFRFRYELVRVEA